MLAFVKIEQELVRSVSELDHIPLGTVSEAASVCFGERNFAVDLYGSRYKHAVGNILLISCNDTVKTGTALRNGKGVLCPLASTLPAVAADYVSHDTSRILRLGDNRRTVVLRVNRIV